MEQNKHKRPVPWNNTVVVCITALLCCFLWGSAFPCIKIGYQIFGIAGDQPAAQIIFAGLRFTLAGILAVLIGSVIYRRLLLPKKESLRPILHLSLLQTTLQYLFFYIGLGQTTGVKSSIIEALSVFVAIFVACLVFRQETLQRNNIVGSVLGFAGVVVLELWGSNESSANVGGWLGIGELCILLSTVAYAFSSVYLRKYSEKEWPFVLSGYQFMVGGVTLVLLGMVMTLAVPQSTGMALADMSAQQRFLETMHMMSDGLGSRWGSGMVWYLALVSAVAYSLWGVLLKYNPVSRVAVYGFMTPVFGVVLSAVLLQEADTIDPGMTVLSLALVSVGTLLAQKKSRDR